MTLTPAYGQDYKSKKEVQAAIDAGKDFIIADFNHPYSGKPINKEQLIESGNTMVNVRYNGSRKITVIKVK